MATVFIIHGSYGHPGENWFPWLKDELEKIGHRVCVPQFPCPKSNAPSDGTHDIHKWFEVFLPYMQYLDRDTIIVAHSRGCVFLYHLLQRLNTPIHTALFVGPFLHHWMRKDWTADENDAQIPFDWSKIKKNIYFRVVYQSTNDEIPIEEGKEIAKNLDAEFILIRNAGHFNIAYDKRFKKFPLFLKKIKLNL
ncbi:MAG: alpha/beta fold hydrolase [Patescibacteria group bacterium]